MAVSEIGQDSIRVLLRWRDIDALGHLYHATMLELLDDARTAWLAGHVSSEASESHVIARLDISYLAEVRRADRWLEVRTEVARVGTKSLVLTESVSNPSGVVVARCRSTIVLWDDSKRTSRLINETELQRMDEFEAHA